MKQRKLKECRIQFGYSQYDMAKKLKLSQSYYSQLENGTRKLYYEQAKKIAKVFNKKPDDLFYPEN